MSPEVRDQRETQSQCREARQYWSDFFKCMLQVQIHQTNRFRRLAVGFFQTAVALFRLRVASPMVQALLRQCVFRPARTMHHSGYLCSGRRQGLHCAHYALLRILQLRTTAVAEHSRGADPTKLHRALKGPWLLSQKGSGLCRKEP